MIRVRSLTFCYPRAAKPALSDIDLEVRAGQIVLLAGATGSGKSTLLKCLRGIIPHRQRGVCSGQVLVAGREPRQRGLAAMSGLVGMVLQNPADQLFSVKVGQEVAAGLHHLGLPPSVVRSRVLQALGRVGLEDGLDLDVATLSGGQRQKVAFAAMLALEPKVLILDEPLSQLHWEETVRLLTLVSRLRRDQGMAIIIAEHRLDPLLEVVDELVVLKRGRILMNGAPASLLDGRGAAILREEGLAIPQTVEIFLDLGLKERPLHCEEALPLLEQHLGVVHRPEGSARGKAGFADPASPGWSLPRAVGPATGRDAPGAVDLRRVCFSYGRRGPTVLHDLDLHAAPSQVLALMGRNGCGKSTLLELGAALHRPRAGKARVLGHDVSRISPYKLGRRVGLLLQNPDLMLCLPTVSKEVGFALVQQKLRPRQIAATTRELLQALGLGHIEDRSPHSLSQGQRLRVAVASLLARELELLLLDEPTTGQDTRGAGLVIDVARKRQPRPTILIATHDVVSVARWADRVALLDQGEVLACGRTADVLGDRNLMTRIGVRPPPSLLLGEALGVGKTLTSRSFVEKLTC